MTTEATTVSLKLSEMSLTQLVQVSQGLGHDIERLREQRRHLKALIEARLANGERESVDAAAAEAATAG